MGSVIAPKVGVLTSLFDAACYAQLTNAGPSVGSETNVYAPDLYIKAVPMIKEIMGISQNENIAVVPTLVTS